MKCDNPPNQEEAVRMCKRGLRYEINERLIGANIKTFDHLNSTVAEVEMFFADNPGLLAGKAKPPKEQGPNSKEVNTLDFTAAVDKAKRILSRISNQPDILVSSFT